MPENTHDALKEISQDIRQEFEKKRRLLSFEEYLSLFASAPINQCRGTARYALDMIEHYGKTPLQKSKFGSDNREESIYRFHVFNEPIDGTAPKLIGHENVQTEIYQKLKTSAQQGGSNKLILLHGPNGSAKTTLVHGLMGGLERYSKEDEGALYTFNWIFPVERFTKGGIGLKGYEALPENLISFSKLNDDEIAAKIPCELKDHPLLLIPPAQRKEYLATILPKEALEETWERLPVSLREGDLCHRCQQIFESILIANGGDYRNVLRHIQVSRFFLTRRYRRGLVTVEPQMHVDAQYRQVTLDKSMSSLPPSLQSLSFFSLGGDLVDANRGVIEYSDLLKRPIDSFKYLLGVCESGSVNIGSSIAYLDIVLLGSTNEVQLDAFKEFPDFSSFKARIELVRVPYLLAVSQEREIYAPLLSQVKGEKHIAPHVDWAAALWAVLTRLKKPNSINYPPSVSSIISSLSPLDKAKLYDQEEMPENLSPEERKTLRSNIYRLRNEYSNIPMYEGRMGASVREMKNTLFDAAHNPEFPCLSPLAVFRELSNLVRRTSEYDFLRQDIKDGYHDAEDFIDTVRAEYLDVIDREVRDSMGLYETTQWEEFMKKYIHHVSHSLKKEKIKNPTTGRTEDPDRQLIQEFEMIVEAPQNEKDLAAFRQNMISQVGAWSLDHPESEVIYGKVFPDFWKKLERHFYESQKSVMTKMHSALVLSGNGADKEKEKRSDDFQLAHRTLKNLDEKFGYCSECGTEVINFLIKNRY
jgi:serine protein kinase